MTTAYYIAHSTTVGGTWYMLLVRDTHFCISCGSDLDKIITSLRRNVKRNKTKERLLRELSGLDCGGKVSPATFEQREEWYRAHGEDYADLVKSTVVEALREAREEEKENSPLRKATTRLKRAGRMTAFAKTVEEKEVIPTPAKDSTTETPKILRKPRVFNRK